MSDTLSLSAVLRRTFSVYIARAPACFCAALILSVVVKLDTALFDRTATVGAGLINLVLLALFVCFVVVVADDVWGRHTHRDTSELMQRASSAVGRLLLVGIVAGVAIGLVSSVGSVFLLAMIFGAAFAAGANLAVIFVIVLLALILLLVPQLYLMTNWAVCLPVAVLESPGGLRALGRSRELVRGNGSRVLALMFILSLLLSVAAGAFASTGYPLGTAPTLICQLLLASVIAPVPALAVTALYHELRELAPGTPAMDMAPEAA
jgi:hypothetical protein